MINSEQSRSNAQSIAIIGPRDSGKTTLAYLLADHLATTLKGRVLIHLQEGEIAEIAYLEARPEPSISRGYLNRKSEKSRPVAVIYDGRMPDELSPYPCRVITLSRS